ncbi:ubiquitin 4 [Hibiscus trionum]|uniref:Ubiquitin 4 n=1 Tax=Hibiscus trionum TaxID=183268 RepID=A0A9W7H3H9_HIBTR|nr:ubiquitin 4 [Hibiscus trionum]
MALSRTKERPNVASSEQEIPIYLKLMKTVALKVKPDETIKNLKALLYEKGIVSSNIQGLFFSGNLLEDDERLVDHGIQRDSTLHVLLRNVDGVKLLVKIPSQQRTLVVEARAHDTVQSIKSSIGVNEGIELDQFSLIYNGQVLQENRTLISLDVKDDSTIHVVFSQKDVLLSVYVKAPTGEVAKLKVKVMFSVADVKAIAESILGASASAGSLFYLGKQLEDSKILACYDIKEESMLEMIHLPFQIFVKPWNGRTITLDVRPSTTVEDVKDITFKKMKILVDPRVILIFSGKRLEFGRNLASYGIQKDCTLCMTLAPSFTVKHMKVRDIGSCISHSSTVHAVKQALLGTRIPVKEVLFGGIALHDDFSLEHYGIDQNTTLTVVF